MAEPLAVVLSEAQMKELAVLIAGVLKDGVNPAPEQPEVWLTVQEAARRIGYKPAWVYARAGSLPFVVRLPNSRGLRVSARRLDAWMVKRGGQ